MDINSISQIGQTGLDINAVKDTQGTCEKQQQSDTVNIGSGTQISNDGKQPEEKDVKKAVDKLNKLLEDKSTHAEYEVCGKFRDLTIRIVDDNTKQVISEIPPKKVIEMVDKLCELAGMFLDQKA